MDIEPLADLACGPAAVLDGLDPTQVAESQWRHQLGIRLTNRQGKHVSCIGSNLSALQRVENMPELRWEPSDFLACLEAEPTIDEDETGYHYSVARDGLRLDLSVFPYASDVCISVYRENVERPVFTFTITACSGTRFVNDGRGEFLQFVPSQVFGDRFHSDFVIPIGVRVSVKPSISIEMFHEPT